MQCEILRAQIYVRKVYRRNDESRDRSGEIENRNR